MTAVHQFLPSLSPRDAIGSHTRAIQRTLRAHGFESDIYAGEIHRELRNGARSHHDWVDGSDAVILYHAAIGCALGDWIATRRERLILDYHNITPPEYFESWQPETGLLLAQGRAQLAKLAPRAALGLADSPFNANELSALGCRQTAVVPIFIEPEVWGEVDAPTRDRLLATKRGIDWLFVGRVAPNKAHHDLICSFAMYQRVFDRDARLWLVGGTSAGDYQRALVQLVDNLGLSECVLFAGAVSDAELGAYFSAADAYVCLSEHEGFCVPLVEAMWWGIPVVAFGAAAVPGTVGDGAIVLEHKNPATVAATVDRITLDAELRAHFVAAGRQRVDEFSSSRTEAVLLEQLARIGVVP